MQQKNSRLVRLLWSRPAAVAASPGRTGRGDHVGPCRRVPQRTGLGRARGGRSGTGGRPALRRRRPHRRRQGTPVKDLSKWRNGDKWIVKDDYVIADKECLYTKDSFGDCQLHVEWAEPAKIEGEGQGRGNSGVFMMGLYEIQVLDSYDNPTYPDGQCGSVYKEIPPLVNVNRKPGEWQTYDIVWHGPRFDADGKLTRKATITVLQNGVLILDHFELLGCSYWDQPPHYERHAEKLPLMLQYHDNPVLFRNTWIRELSGPPMREGKVGGGSRAHHAGEGQVVERPPIPVR